MTTSTLEGFATGFADRSYPNIAGGVPVLTSFYFGFGVGGRPVDNHLNSMMVLPGGRSVDVTPNADLQPSNIGDGRAQLLFRDEDPSDDKDEYFFHIGHLVLNDQFARRFQLRDVGGTGEIRRRLPQAVLGPSGGPGVGAAVPGSILALAGFKLFFTGGRDHQVDEIAVLLEDDGDLVVAFNDRNDDDVFGYLVDLVRIPRLGMTVIPGESSGSAEGGERVTLARPGHTDLVLRGFRFDFRSGDHDLRDIGVVRRGDRLEIFFGDEEGNDRFDWIVRWAHIGPQVFAPV
jgi:hypothetical protein